VQGGEANEYVITVFNEGTATQNSYTVNLMQQDTRLLLATLNVTTPLDPVHQPNISFPGHQAWVAPIRSMARLLQPGMAIPPMIILR
jgi:hypothetical protein